jgi:CRP-like cAMP-binding protein
MINYLLLLMGNISSACSCCSFLMRDILKLRLLAIAASSMMIVYYYFYPAHPLLLNVGWKAFFIVINIYQVAMLLYERSQTHLDSPEEELLYHRDFSQLSIVEFKSLLNIGTEMTVPAGYKLTQQNQPVFDLIAITKGIAAVSVDGRLISYCRPGNLVGEMSFMTASTASATVESIEPMSMICWNQDHVRSLLVRKPHMAKNLQAMLNQELIKKLQSTIGNISSNSNKAP